MKGAGLIESKIPLVHVQRFLNRFHHPVSRLFSRALSTWLSLDFKIQNVDQRISWIYAKTGWVLFHKVFIDASLVLGGWATFLFVKSFVCLHYTPASFLDAPWKWLVAYLILIPVIPIHELAHALTTKHFGYRVRDFGFTLLHHVLPVFYADVTDIWMASAHVRMKVAFAGPYSSWLLGSLAVLASLFFPRYEFIFYLFAFNCYVGTLINLYPFLFLEMDGYYILIDLLKFPHLRKEAIHALKNISSFGREKKQGIPLAYGLISIVSIGLILTYSIWSFLNGKI
ncbi:MAG: hypothetical protein HYS07_01680 [Chlamydiae bacterium]|nr:hypothetical protein [Chlamydiota bacterium]